MSDEYIIDGASSPLSPVGAKLFGADAAGNVGWVDCTNLRSVSQGCDSIPDVNIFDLVKAQDSVPLNLPNPYSAAGPKIVHPSVLFFQHGLFGYRYWMAYTPYPNDDSQYENPCVAVSQDGLNWAAPDGVTNPLTETIANGYNSDTYIFTNPDGSKLFVAYRERNFTTQLASVMVMESSNGVDWSAPVAIKSGLITGDQDYASPSIWFDTTASVWKMISHNLDFDGVIRPVQLSASTTDDLYGTWGDPVDVVFPTPNSGETWWHTSIRKITDTHLVGVGMQSIAGSWGDIYWLESLDGGATFGAKIIYVDNKNYQCALSVAVSDGAPVVSLWRGTQAIYREVWEQGLMLRRRIEAIAAKSAGDVSKIKLLDSFNRDNGAIGTPDVGLALTVDTGSFVIAANKCSSGSAGSNRGLVNIGVSDYYLSCDLDFVTKSCFAIVRAASTANYYRIGYTSTGQIGVQAIVSGGINYQESLVTLYSNSSRIEIVCVGRSIRIYIDGTLYKTINDTMFSNATSIGIQCTDAGQTVDNLMILSLD